VAYRDDGAVLQLVPLGTVAKPLPVADLLAQVKTRITGAAVSHVLKFAPTSEADHDDNR
jgi:hypothetical protein